MEKQNRTMNVHVGMVARAHGLPSEGDKTGWVRQQSMSGEHQATRGDDGEREIEDSVSAVLTQLNSGLEKCQELC